MGGYVKGALGGTLLLLTLWIHNTDVQSLDCSDFHTQCTSYFGVVLDQAANEANLHLTRQSEALEYCKCFTSCVNYITVFNGRGDAKVPTNCFVQSSLAGLQGVATSPQASGETFQLVPSMPMHSCVTCSNASQENEGLIKVLSWLALLSGIAMFTTAGCEHMEIKHHNGLFAILVLAMDFFRAILLFITMTSSIAAAKKAHDSCDPTGFSMAIKQGGLDTISSNVDAAAIFTNFLALMLDNLSEDTCHQLRIWAVFAMVTAVSSLANLWAFSVTVFLCLGCTDDGIDDHSDDEKALDLHALHFSAPKPRLVRCPS